ncbi:MAG: holo-ACP synthase, partial [Vibrio sp.]
PLLNLSGKAALLATQLQVANIHLSISDERHYAMATVILERR